MPLTEVFYSFAKKLLKEQYNESMPLLSLTVNLAEAIDSSHCTFNNFLADEQKTSPIVIGYLCFMHHLMEPVIRMKTLHKWQNFGYFLIVPTRLPPIST